MNLFQLDDLYRKGIYWQKATVYSLGNLRGGEWLLDTSNGDRYRLEEALDLRIKCALVFMVVPLLGVSKTLWHLARLPRVLQERPRADFSIGFLMHQLFRAALRPSLYAFFVSCSAFYGVYFSALEGRKWVALFENRWNDSFSYRSDVRKALDQNDNLEEVLQEAFKNNRITFYLAYCFQPRGNVRDSIMSWVHLQ